MARAIAGGFLPSCQCSIMSVSLSNNSEQTRRSRENVQRGEGGGGGKSHMVGG